MKSSGHVGMPRAPATTRLCPLPPSDRWACARQAAGPPSVLREAGDPVSPPLPPIPECAQEASSGNALWINNCGL